MPEAFQPALFSVQERCQNQLASYSNHKVRPAPLEKNLILTACIRADLNLSGTTKAFNHIGEKSDG